MARKSVRLLYIEHFKMVNKNNKRISVTLPKKLVHKIEKMAAVRQLPKSLIVRELIEKGGLSL